MAQQKPSSAAKVLAPTPPAPPAPRAPGAAVPGKAAAVAVAAAPPQTTKEKVQAIVKDLHDIASVMPSPAVTDSALHARVLHHHADTLKEIAEKL
jgi:hypothetical protein